MKCRCWNWLHMLSWLHMLRCGNKLHMLSCGKLVGGDCQLS
jgi:hypothetical protein